MYAFLFDRRSLALLISGIFLLGALLFFGGMMVGMGVEHDRARSVAAPQPNPATFTSVMPTDLGVEPLEWRTADGASIGDVPTASPPPTVVVPAPAGGATSGSSSAGSAKGGSAAPAPPADSWADRPASDSSAPQKSTPGGSTEAPASTASGSDTTPASTIYFTVQVGAFSERATAEGLVSRLEGEGWDALTVRLIDTGGTTLYGVQMGCWDSESKADAEAARYQAAGHDKPVVKALPPGVGPDTDAAR